MLIAGLVFLCLALHTMWLGYLSRHWPRTDALITKSERHYMPKAGSYLEVSYTYNCGARNCIGHRWRYKLFTDGPDVFSLRTPSDVIDAALASYPPGRKVQVAVRPAQPDRVRARARDFDG